MVKGLQFKDSSTSSLKKHQNPSFLVNFKLGGLMLCAKIINVHMDFKHAHVSLNICASIIDA